MPEPGITAAGLHQTRILLVDDHAVVRYGIAQLINREPDLLVCGEEEDAARGFSAVQKLQPDLVITDLMLKDSSGLELVRNINAHYEALPVLVLTLQEESLYASVALRAGASGYLMKQQPLCKIVEAIRRVLGGQVYLSDALTLRILQQQVRGRDAAQALPLTNLSDRELEIFQLIGQWKPSSEIARQLHLSIKTIEGYREQMKRKLNLNSAMELIRFANSWASA